MNIATKTIPFVDLSLQHQPIQTEIEQAIQAVLQQGDYVLGQALTEFEMSFATACQTEYGIGVACGTDAIALGLQACGVGPGDEVILPANTFIATLIGVLRAGATPVLVDCELETGLMDLAAAAQAITPKTKVLLPVHLYGQMVSPRQLLDLAEAHNLLIFEDAAQAHLAERDGYRAGSVGIAAAFSFYPSKNLGAVVPMTNQSGSGHVYHLYVMRVQEDLCPLDRKLIQEELSAQGIQSGIHYPIPCHLQPAFQNLGYKLGDFPQAEQLCQEILSLPMYPGLKLAQVERVVTCLRSLVKAYPPVVSAQLYTSNVA
jgi:dTDP-4-amino-4,6-dideoxygalactose transaminase